MPRCKAITKNGKRCKKDSVDESDFCFFHLPKKTAKKSKTQTKTKHSNRFMLIRKQLLEKIKEMRKSSVPKLF